MLMLRSLSMKLSKVIRSGLPNLALSDSRIKQPLVNQASSGDVLEFEKIRPGRTIRILSYVDEGHQRVIGIMPAAFVSASGDDVSCAWRNQSRSSFALEGTIAFGDAIALATRYKAAATQDATKATSNTRQDHAFLVRSVPA